MKRLIAPLAIAASMTGAMAATETPSLARAVPALEHDDTTVVQGKLWLRRGLAPRDSSLVTPIAPVAAGQAEQVPFYRRRAMDNGQTQAEAAGALTQLAFYADWPRVFAAMPVFREVFDACKATE